MADSIKISELNTAIQNALEDYNKNVVTGLKKHTRRAMKDLVDNTRATAPVGKRSDHYRDSIASQVLTNTEYGLTMQWYVKGSDYRLTHLLNNGHALRDGGRYEGTNFLGNTVNQILPWYMASIEEVIKNG